MADPMPDRGARNPAPLSANGRLFVMGERVLFGIDAYNGTILWCLSVPAIRRSNMPRDSSNMVASDDYLYLASGGHCQGIDAQRGEPDLLFQLVENREAIAATGERLYDWGYLACVGDTLEPRMHAAYDEGYGRFSSAGEVVDRDLRGWGA